MRRRTFCLSYVITYLLGRPGPLIGEDLLATRLGVDLRSDDWPALRELLKVAGYQGVFCAGYVRWWMPLVLDWWAREIDADRAPFRLGAADRVKVLQHKTGLGKLAAIAENPHSPGTKFGTSASNPDFPSIRRSGFR